MKHTIPFTPCIYIVNKIYALHFYTKQDKKQHHRKTFGRNEGKSDAIVDHFIFMFTQRNHINRIKILSQIFVTFGLNWAD